MHEATCSRASSSLASHTGGPLSSDLPQPWDESLLPRYAGWNDRLSRSIRSNESRRLRVLFAQNRAALNKSRARFGADASQALIRRIQADVATVGAYGIQYTPLQRAGYGPSAESVARDKHLRNSLLILAGGDQGRPGLSATDEIILQCDNMLRHSVNNSECGTFRDAADYQSSQIEFSADEHHTQATTSQTSANHHVSAFTFDLHILRIYHDITQRGKSS